MSALITSLAQQHTPFIVAFRATHSLYGCSITQFAAYWNWAKSL